MAVTATFKQNHPAANNEAQPIHAHLLWPLDRKPDRSKPETSLYEMLSAESKPVPKAGGSMR
jgi:hypothetical protein